MSTTFSRSMRSLERDGFHFTLAALLFATLLLAAWGAWFFLAAIPVYAVTNNFRIDTSGPSTRILAEFDVGEARAVRPQQNAWLRSNDTRALSATVARVSETRVELIVHEPISPNLPNQGQVEIEIERATPSTLLLRSIGRD